MNKVIVTGGAGFIGSHLVDTLLSEGQSVTVIDDLSVGRLDNLSLAIESHKDKVQFIKADISCYSEEWASEFAGAKTVYHLAARADIVPSIDNPKLYFDVNVSGTVNVLQAMQSAGVDEIVYAASSSCYGIPSEYPTAENAPIDLRYPYAASKYFGEQTLKHYSEVFNLKATSLRFFNVYGPRARTSGTYGAVFGVFLAQKINSQPLTVVGDGTQTRDFTYVSDVVNAIIVAANAQGATEPRFAVYNVGSGATVSVNRLVDLLDSKKVHIPRRPGEPDCTFANIDKIRSELDWEPKVSIEEGVGHLLDHIDLWADAPVWNPATIEKATESWFRYLD